MKKNSETTPLKEETKEIKVDDIKVEIKEETKEESKEEIKEAKETKTKTNTIDEANMSVDIEKPNGTLL